jgi:phage regulator Rha-like protein
MKEIQKKCILILYLEIRGRLQPFFVDFKLDFIDSFEKLYPTLANVFPLISKYRQAG